MLYSYKFSNYFQLLQLSEVDKEIIWYYRKDTNRYLCVSEKITISKSINLLEQQQSDFKHRIDIVQNQSKICYQWVLQADINKNKKVKHGYSWHPSNLNLIHCVEFQYNAMYYQGDSIDIPDYVQRHKELRYATKKRKREDDDKYTKLEMKISQQDRKIDMLMNFIKNKYPEIIDDLNDIQMEEGIE